VLNKNINALNKNKALIYFTMRSVRLEKFFWHSQLKAGRLLLISRRPLGRFFSSKNLPRHKHK
jgi:hypothetical protein